MATFADAASAATRAVEKYMVSKEVGCGQESLVVLNGVDGCFQWQGENS
jgi:hypothetical protein